MFLVACIVRIQRPKLYRQIMFLVACIVWVVEFVYDMAFPGNSGKPEEKKKKSILKKAKKTT